MIKQSIKSFKENDTWEKVFTIIIGLLICAFLVVMALLTTRMITDFTDRVNKNNLIETTSLSKYNTELVDSSYKSNPKEFSGPYLAKNNNTGIVQDVYVLCKDNNVSLYKKQNDEYIEL